MKTTEIFVEQVLIGLLVLATGFLPYINHKEITGYFKGNPLVEGALIVAIAYLLGIVLDRFADTLLSRLEQYYRLKFTINLIKKPKQNSKQDPFPEDYLQVKILKECNETSERMHYLRSRIRLSRALAVFTPALTISGLLSLWQYKNNIPPANIPVYLGITTLIYILCFICVSKLHEPPKTNEIEIKDVKFLWWLEPTTIAAGLLFAMMVCIALLFHQEHTWVVLLTGLGISALSAWSWWRIYQTFMKFLMKCNSNDN